MTSITIDPMTRIEGHLSVHTETEFLDSGEGSRVTEAKCEGEMFRGFENILTGRDPLDAQQITQRICGVCPISHGIASIQAQEMAYGIVPTNNGRLLQNLIFAANYLQSHVLHFYHLAALDFVDVTAVTKYSGQDRTLLSLKSWVDNSLARNDVFPAAPFLPRVEGDYVEDVEENCVLLSHYAQALEVRKTCHEMAAVFGARVPHSTAIVPGGCTQVPTLERVLAYASRLRSVAAFVRDTYIPDLLRVAKAFPQYFDIGKGCGNYLSYGVFRMDDHGTNFFGAGTVLDGRWAPLDEQGITEDVTHSRFEQQTALHPSRGETLPQPKKTNAYSWLKAPRYHGNVMEVGPLARVVTNYLNPETSWVKREVDNFLTAVDLPLEKMFSVLGRHVARGLESLWLAKQAMTWLDEIEIDGPPAAPFEIPRQAVGYGLTEAPRGALGHWLSIEDYHIENYQCVVPTTWNCSPRDAQGYPGAVEQALTGITVANPDQPIEVGRVVRSFDPCLGCAIH